MLKYCTSAVVRHQVFLAKNALATLNTATAKLDKGKIIDIRYVVSEVYLHKDGETLEIIFHNQLWRKLKADSVSNLYYIPTLKTPMDDENSQPMKGDSFPEVFPYDDLRPAGWAWKKYYRNPRNYVVLPKNANYIDLEILTAVFRGKMIDTSKQYVKEIKENKKDLYYFM